MASCVLPGWSAPPSSQTPSLSNAVELAIVEAPHARRRRGWTGYGGPRRGQGEACAARAHHRTRRRRGAGGRLGGGGGATVAEGAASRGRRRRETSTPQARRAPRRSSESDSPIRSTWTGGVSCIRRRRAPSSRRARSAVCARVAAPSGSPSSTRPNSAPNSPRRLGGRPSDVARDGGDARRTAGSDHVLAAENVRSGLASATSIRAGERMQTSLVCYRSSFERPVAPRAGRREAVSGDAARRRAAVSALSQFDGRRPPCRRRSVRSPCSTRARRRRSCSTRRACCARRLWHNPRCSGSSDLHALCGGRDAARRARGGGAARRGGRALHRDHATEESTEASARGTTWSGRAARRAARRAAGGGGVRAGEAHGARRPGGAGARDGVALDADARWRRASPSAGRCARRRARRRSRSSTPSRRRGSRRSCGSRARSRATARGAAPTLYNTAPTAPNGARPTLDEAAAHAAERGQRRPRGASCSRRVTKRRRLQASKGATNATTRW